ncbi:hypothetical protein ACHAWX_005182 [Stephanocyclus meneghinianus]
MSAHGLAARRKHDNLCPDVHQGIGQDLDSEIEDVTDQYVTKKKPRPSSSEIIEVEDVSSDDESCSDLKPCSISARSVGKAHAGVNFKKSGRENDDFEGECSSDDDCESDIEDVTEFMLTKKKEELLNVIREAIDLGDSDDEDAVEQGMNTSRKSPSGARRSGKVSQPPIEVSMSAEDIPTCPGMKGTADKDDSSNEGHPKENDVDHTIKQRIIKLLNTGFYAESNENEARNAMKLARRLIERYNLDQSLLLRKCGDGSSGDFSTNKDDSNCPNALRGGIVNVSVRNRKKGTDSSSLPRWIDFLAKTICANFHVDAFKNKSRAKKHERRVCTISIYGIKTNAQLAAYAFKVAAERISLMAEVCEPPVMRRSTPNMRTARLSYALEIVSGLNTYVTEGLLKEEKRRKSKLFKARRAAKFIEACHEDSDGNERSSRNHMSLEQLECENAARLALIEHQKKIAEDVK